MVQSTNGEQPQYVIGHVAHPAALYRIPWPNSPTIISVAEGATVIAVERTESRYWLNVIYVDATSQEILGWLPARDVEDMASGSRSVEIPELPITEFEYNNRKDIDDLHFYVRNISGTGCALTLVAVVALLGILYGFCTLVLIRDGDAFALIQIVAGAIILAACINWHKSSNRKATLKRQLHLGLSNWQRRLETIGLNKTSATNAEMMYQAKLAAMKIAANITSQNMTSRQL